MKLKTVTNKDWYKWYKDFHSEIAEEDQKLKCDSCKYKHVVPENMSISEWFEWDGTHTTDDILRTKYHLGRPNEKRIRKICVYKKQKNV